MFGKHFESMYSGSMFGKSAVVFAVWGYVIAFQRPSRKHKECFVELNPPVLAATFSSTVAEITAAIEELEQPDPASRSELDDGRRLVRVTKPGEQIIGPTLFRVVNGTKYRELRDEEERRLYNMEAKRKERFSKSNKSANVSNVSHGQPPSAQAENRSREQRTEAVKTKTLTEAQGFEDIWKGYPNKRGKVKALGYFHAQVKTPDDYEAITGAVENYRREIEILGTEDRFIMHGKTFFNQVWRDYTEGTWVAPTGKPSQPEIPNPFADYKPPAPRELPNPFEDYKAPTKADA